MNKLGTLLLIMIIAIASVAVYSGEGDTTDGETDDTQQSDSGEIKMSDSLFSNRDKAQTWDSDDAIYIHLDDGITVSDNAGVVISEGTITITSEGTYVLDGTLSDGRIIVDSTSKTKIQLVLNGVDVTCSDNAAIYIAQADKVFITLADGTTNTLSTGDRYCDDAVENGIDGVIHSKDDLTINGSGTLVIIANYDHGIVSKDDLIITGGTFNITSVGDGLKGKDCVAICDGTFTLNAGGDGIQSNEDEDASKGYVYISGGTYAITAEKDGIQAETELIISGGEFEISTGGGYTNGVTHANNTMPGAGNWNQGGMDQGQFPQQSLPPGNRNQGGMNQGQFPQQSLPPGEWEPEDMDQGQFPQQSPLPTWGNTEGAIDDGRAESAKGLKAGIGVIITGGTIELNCADDAIHSDGYVQVSGGTLTLRSGDDAIHADQNLTVEGGEINIPVCYEGLEGASVDILGGTISIIAEDDGINAAGEGYLYVHIGGGITYIQGGDDGIDSNGDLIIDGGELYVSGPDSVESASIGPGAEALDYGMESRSQCVINGGTLVASSIYAMGEGFQSSSTQASVFYRFKNDPVIDAGTEITVADSEGTVLISYVAQKSFSSVAFSSPLLRVGETYTLTAGDYTASITLTSIATNSDATFTGTNMPRR